MITVTRRPTNAGFFMLKKDYFIQLHQELEAKYHIPPHCVRTIRNLALGQKMSREEIMDWADEKTKFYKNIKGATEPRKYSDLFNFLEDLQDDVWEEITQITKYDKS